MVTVLREESSVSEKTLVRLGLDLGPGKSHLAVVQVEVGGRFRIRHLATVDTPELRQALRAVLEEHAPGVAVVEDVGKRPLKGRMSWEEWRRMRSLVDRTVAFLEKMGVQVLTPRAVVQGAWYGEDEPGWRQSFTGLTRPREMDVMWKLEGMRKEGTLAGPTPRNPHQADALAMALWSVGKEG